MAFAGNWREEEAENGSCSGVIDRPSCYLSPTELGELDAVATIRMIVSCLSLIGALSVITSAILRREYFNPKVHPIFVLSIADTLLAVFYIIGGIVWLRRESNVMSRVWCFAASLPTVILQCVTVNLTVLYAVLAYSGVRRKHFGNLLDGGDNKESVWSPRRTLVSYMIVWVLPAVVVMVLFGAVVGDTGLLGRVNECSCWCYPSLGNVLPYAHGRDEPTMRFRRDMRKVVVSNATVIGTHFLAGFIVLVIVYRLIIKTIHRMRITARGGQVPKPQYGAIVATQTEAVLERAEFLAKRRVVYFLVAFMVSGFFNFILCYELMLYDVTSLVTGEKESPSIVDSNHQDWRLKLYYITLCLQSLTITQQGFLNAIVYGWTREDFLHIMAVNRRRKKKQAHQERQYSSSDSEEEVVEEEEEEEEEEEVLRRPSNVREEHTFTHSLVDTDASGTDIEDVLEQST